MSNFDIDRGSIRSSPRDGVRAVVVVVVGGLEQFSVSPRPLGFGFGTKGFGARA